jgi:hypothetical protein
MTGWPKRQGLKGTIISLQIIVEALVALVLFLPGTFNVDKSGRQ